MTDQTVIAVGGENLIDHVTHDGVVSACPGGSPFNVAMALGRQAANVYYISPISTDHWGDLLAGTLEQSGVTLAGGRHPAPSTMARVTVSGGTPTYKFERDQTAERMITHDRLLGAMPVNANIIHTGSLGPTDGKDADIWETFCHTCFDRGQMVSIDPNVRLSVISDVESYRARIFRMVGHAHLVKLSDEDLEGLFPEQSQEQALDALLAMTSARLVVLTRGPGHITAFGNGERLDIDAAPVPNLIDSVGAGDTFTATLLAGLAASGPDPLATLSNLTRDGLTELLHRASLAAAINCGREGCNPPHQSDIIEHSL